MSSLQIKHAIESISLNYQAMSLNAKEASYHFDFHTNVKPFIDFLQKHNN
jgi:hypothetical protein